MSGVNIFNRLLEGGLPTRDVQVALSETVSDDQQVAIQSNHDNLNVNASMQFAADSSTAPADVSNKPPASPHAGRSRTDNHARR